MQKPRGLKAAGAKLWRSVTDVYDLEPPVATVFAEACRMVDLLADLRAEVAETGLMVDSSQGIRVSPAAVEARQLTLALAKLLGTLGLPRGGVQVKVAEAAPQIGDMPFDGSDI